MRKDKQKKFTFCIGYRTRPTASALVYIILHRTRFFCKFQGGSYLFTRLFYTQDKWLKAVCLQTDRRLLTMMYISKEYNPKEIYCNISLKPICNIAFLPFDTYKVCKKKVTGTYSVSPTLNCPHSLQRMWWSWGVFELS